MKRIPLTRGKVALIDDEDFDRVSQYTWFCRAEGYAARGYVAGYRDPTQPHSKNSNQIIKIEYLHRFLMKPPDGMTVNHINGNRLDDRRCNLRICTKMESSRNRKAVTPGLGRKRRGRWSKFKGVCYLRGKENVSRWRAQIHVGGRVFYGGHHRTAEEAARAYDRLAIQYFGEFARLNFNDA
jgi:hypothetical protein